MLVMKASDMQYYAASRSSGAHNCVSVSRGSSEVVKKVHTENAGLSNQPERNGRKARSRDSASSGRYPRAETDRGGKNQRAETDVGRPSKNQLNGGTNQRQDVDSAKANFYLEKQTDVVKSRNADESDFTGAASGDVAWAGERDSASDAGVGNWLMGYGIRYLVLAVSTLVATASAIEFALIALSL